jgi:CheY-like chemotaxis protein
MATILCIDNYTRRSNTRNGRLRACGYSVLQATDFREGLDLFANNVVDAVVLDCGTEAVDTFVTTLRSVRSAIPVIMLSGFCRGRCRLVHKADACLQRNENSDLLIGTLETTIRWANYGLVRSVPIH